MWSISLMPFINSTTFAADGPEVAFTAFAIVCLFTSVLWHTMSGCAHPVGMEFCARVDYVGIGWYVEPCLVVCRYTLTAFFFAG
jgi:adiponectin receptor